MFDFLRHRSQIFNEVENLAWYTDFLSALKDWLYWKAQKWARDHVRCLKPWFFKKRGAPKASRIVSLSVFDREEELAELIDTAVRERLFAKFSPEAILLKYEAELLELIAYKDRYELLAGLHSELKKRSDVPAKQQLRILDYILTGDYKQRGEILEKTGCSESNWNSLKQRVRRRARHLQPLAA